MTLSSRESNFLTAFRKQIRIAIDAGGRPSLNALIELAGFQYQQFASTINKLTDNELQGLNYDLKKLGIENRAIATILSGPRSANRQPSIQHQESSVLESTCAVLKALSLHNDADRKRIMDTVEVYFFGPTVRPVMTAVPSLMDFGTGERKHELLVGEPDNASA